MLSSDPLFLTSGLLRLELPMLGITFLTTNQAATAKTATMIIMRPQFVELTDPVN